MSTGNMTAIHDLQLAAPSQPLSQTTGKDTLFMAHESLHSCRVSSLFVCNTIMTLID